MYCSWKESLFFTYLIYKSQKGKVRLQFSLEHVLLLIQAKIYNCFRIMGVFLTLIRTICNHNGEKRKCQKCVFPCAGLAATGDGTLAGTGDAGASSTTAAGTWTEIEIITLLRPKFICGTGYPLGYSDFHNLMGFTSKTNWLSHFLRICIVPATCTSSNNTHVYTLWPKNLKLFELFLHRSIQETQNFTLISNPWK
jgi:hypothetical protein